MKIVNTFSEDGKEHDIRILDENVKDVRVEYQPELDGKEEGDQQKTAKYYTKINTESLKDGEIYTKVIRGYIRKTERKLNKLEG